MSGSVAELVRGFTRSIRAMGYYDASHPVFVAARKEAFDALQGLWAERDALTLGGAGSHLVVDEAGATLVDEPSRALATRMFEAQVVALRLHREVTERDLGHLMRVLAERPERIRAAGGAQAVLQKWGTRGLEVLEVDFGALFSGAGSDLAPLVGGDPVAIVALKEVLRFKEARSADEEALAVRLEGLATPESLGAFLDELLDAAGPAVVHGGSGVLTSDDVADRAVQAFLRQQERLARAPAPEALLGRSADALSAALVRLAPEARFALLRRLAGERDEDPLRAEAAARVGARLEDGVIASAVAAALLGQGGDPDAVRAVGDLVRRLRPIQDERRSLLESLDHDMAAAGQPIDGVLWQQLQARAYEESGLGVLSLEVEGRAPALALFAQERLRGVHPSCAGQDVLHTTAAPVVENWTMRTWVAVLRGGGRLREGSLAEVERMVLDLDAQGAGDEAVMLLAALSRRTDREDGAPALAAVRRVLDSERGVRLSRALVLRPDVPGAVVGDLVLSALEEAVEPRAQAWLTGRLQALGADDLVALAQRELPAASARRAGALLEAAFGLDPKVGLKVARLALKTVDLRVKGHVIKGLVEHPSSDVVALLAHVAGWKGDKYTVALLGLSGEGLKWSHRLQLAAVGALGLGKSPLAVGPLLELCTRSKLISDAEAEALQIGAAQALLTNGTPEASKALDEIAQHKKRAVREIARRVLAGRR